MAARSLSKTPSQAPSKPVEPEMTAWRIVERAGSLDYAADDLQKNAERIRELSLMLSEVAGRGPIGGGQNSENTQLNSTAQGVSMLMDVFATEIETIGGHMRKLGQDARRVEKGGAA